MILSFDLDGVIADADTGVLSLLHGGADDAAIATALPQYYARRRLLLNPQLLIGPSDTYHVITGRGPSIHAVTRKWIAHFLPTCSGVHLVGDDLSVRLIAKGRAEEAAQLLARRKAQVIRAVGSTVHFDNNPTIVQQLRERGITAIQVGGGLA